MRKVELSASSFPLLLLAARQARRRRTAERLESFGDNAGSVKPRRGVQATEANFRALCRRGRRPRSFGRVDVGGTRRSTPASTIRSLPEICPVCGHML
jgi:hypothetical protein